MKLALFFLILFSISGFANQPSDQNKGVYGPQDLVSPSEGKNLLAEYKRALISQKKSQQHQHSIEKEELQRSLEIRRKDALVRAAEEQRKFFETKHDPLARKVYLKQASENQKAYFEELSLEIDELDQRHKKETESLIQNQDQKWHQFKTQVEQGVRPSAQLWK